MNTRILFFWMLMQLLSPSGSYGQWEGSVRITGVSAEVSDDSLRIRFTLTAERLNIGSKESLTLAPRLEGGKSSIPLPEVIYSGKLRSRYDDRKYTLSGELHFSPYRVYPGVSRERVYRLEYEAAVPYAPRLQSGQLVVTYRFTDCCSNFPTREERYDFLAGSPQETPPPASTEPREQPVVSRDTVYVRQVVEKQPVAEPAPPSPSPRRKARRETLFVEYPVNGYRVIPDYGRNTEELRRLDRFLEDYTGRIRVTAYASPEGRYDRNEALAENRAEYFGEYLSKWYGIPASSITPSYVAEDWEGLRRLIAESSLAGRTGALRIIDGTGIFEGREKKLMDFRGGEFWKQLGPIFRQLRRIEVEIDDND
jgi:outer membrane protein OmpA-like peptidoglycan-associated protein